MKIKKLLSIVICIMLITLIFQSCNSKEYNSSLSCKEFSNELKSEISVPNDEFDEYTNEDLKFLFSSPAIYDDISIIYSADSTDVCELGVIHATDKESAKSLFEEAKLYIKNLQEQKSDFLRSYSPAELIKLNSAEARHYGNYVIFAVADQDTKNRIFNKAETLLS